MGGVNLVEAYVFLNIVLTAMGACMAYVVFISTTLPDVIPKAEPVCIPPIASSSACPFKLTALSLRSVISSHLPFHYTVHDHLGFDPHLRAAGLAANV